MEGFSLDAQRRLLREYADGHDIRIEKEFVDVETARASGRTQFGEMLAYLRKHRAASPIILVEKTDRLYRNLTDYATLDELRVTIHLVKENQIIGPDSKSSEQFVHGIKVLVARNYSQNLGEETVKGMTEKARAGIYPSCAPIGYLNVDGPSGKRIIAPDPEHRADHHARYSRAFRLASIPSSGWPRHCGARACDPRGRTLNSSLVHHILRKRIYMGDFEFDGTTYQGSTSHWSPVNAGIACRDCWMLGPKTRPGR